jgi:hypothetical protein
MTALFYLSHGLVLLGWAVILVKEYRDYRRNWK